MITEYYIITINVLVIIIDSFIIIIILFIKYYYLLTLCNIRIEIDKQGANKKDELGLSILRTVVRRFI